MNNKKPTAVTAKHNQMFQDAIALHQSGQFDLAEVQYKKLLESLPSNILILNNLAGIAFQRGNFEEGLKIINQSLSISPNQPSSLNNRANALRELKRLDEALESYDQAIALKPDHIYAYSNRGNLLRELNRLDEALISCNYAVTLKPDYADAHYNCGNVLRDLKRFEEAVISYDQAIALKPEHADAYCNRGNILKEIKRLDEAIISYERAIEINPNMDFLLSIALFTRMRVCMWDNFQSRLNELTNKIKNNEKVSDAFSILALIDNLEIHRKTAEILVEAKYPPNNILPEINLYSKRDKIRIGYFSPDFKNHPVSFLTAELYERHDRNKFEIHAFSFSDSKDEMTNRIEAGVDHFHDVSKTLDKDVALLSRKLEIDIAVDLGGYTKNGRTEIFAMRAAPIQMSYIGYLGTMAASYFDYLIADPIIIPQEHQKYYSEKIIYLPSYQVNDSKKVLPTNALTRAEFGLPEKGFVFCCFNNTYKITPDTLDSWVRILKRVGDSVLFVYVENESAENNLRKEIISQDLATNRLVFGKRLDVQEYLARYRAADLFLDTFPYNAGTTGSDALRMGLPIITYMGKSFASRMAASLLTNLNLPELITSSRKDYENLAVELATNPEKLKDIKDKLLVNLPTSPLYNTKLFTKNIESAYSAAFERYQNGLDPDHIFVASSSSKRDPETISG
jgi:predicted O-linked N-acetylglucosamine transferase (SPINDLY family)